MNRSEQLFFGSLFYILYFSIFALASSVLFELGQVVSGFLALMFTLIGFYYRLTIQTLIDAQPK